MGLENQIQIVTERINLPRVDFTSKVSRKFTNDAFLNFGLKRAHKACDKAAKRFAGKKGYDVIHKKSSGLWGDYIAIAEYDFYLSEKASLAK